MKIAMIGHKRIPGREGGVEVVVEELSKRMALNNKVICYNRKKKGVSTIKEYEGVKIITVPTIEKKSLDALIYSFFATIHALFQKYDVIHYHALGPSVMLIIPHIFGKKTVVTVHGLNYKTPKWKGFGAKYIMLGERISAKYADEIIVLSKEQQKYLKEKYNRDSIFIPNGVTINEFNIDKDFLNRYDISADNFILFVSRIVPGKGLENLIDAYNNLDTDMPLLIVGGTSFVDEFYNNILEKCKSNDKIRIVGFVEGEDLFKLYAAAKLYVFPSEAEGMPMCLLEALSCNAKCLVSDIPENKEVGKDYVQYFKVGDTKDLTKRIKKCLEESNKSFEKESKTYIEENYDWDVITSQTIDAYSKILKRY